MSYLADLWIIFSCFKKDFCFGVSTVMKDSNVNSQNSGYKKGLMAGLPICLGYLPISFAFGITAAKMGLAVWISEFMSALIYTGAGQMSALNLIKGGEELAITFALTMFVVNCRYILLSLSLSQKLDRSMNTFQRLIFSFFNTDEIFAVAMQENGYLKAPYLFGIATLPYIGWITGSALGILFTDLLPASLSSALGMLIFGMYIAIIVPPAKKSKPITFVILNAIIISVLLECNPIVRSYLSPAWIIIICAVVTSVIGSIFFPIETVKEGE